MIRMTRMARSHLGIGERVSGYHQPWEYRCNYCASYSDAALSYLNPDPLLHKEMELTRRTLDESPDRVTVSYVTSASSMICKYGKPGCDQVLDDAQRLCLQLLYERQGAIKISMCADHGHNFMRSTNVLFDDVLKQAGFHITDSVRGPRDVVIDVDGLVTYLGLHTQKPAEVADAVLKRNEVEIVTYLQQDHMIVRDHDGAARSLSKRAIQVHADVQRRAAIQRNRRAVAPDGKVDADGFIADADWLARSTRNFPMGPSGCGMRFTANASVRRMSCLRCAMAFVPATRRSKNSSRWPQRTAD